MDTWRTQALHIMGLAMEWLGLHLGSGQSNASTLMLDCSHNMFLMALSYGVICAACLATLDIGERIIHAENQRSRQRWQVMGALCLAGGIWAMHFIGMLAFEIPMKVSYDLPITIASLLVAAISGACAIRAISREVLSPGEWLLSAAGIGLGVIIMHYMGMSALRSAAVQYYQPGPFGLSIVMAILCGAVFLLMPGYLRQGSGMFHQMLKYGASMLLGAGLLGTHMVGMWSLNMVLPENAVLQSASPENGLQLGLTIAVIALLITAASISASMADKKLQSKEHDLRRVNALLGQLDQARMSLQQVAHYDPLTNLINRRGFNQTFAEKLIEHSANNQMLAVMFLDVDHFKRINDSLGHDAGDELLKAIAERISSATRTEDVVSRFGGDEFCILISLHNYEEVEHLANRVMQKMKEPIALAGRHMVMTTSIGISVFPQDGLTCDELLKHADLALYQSKGNGRNRLHFFSSNLKAKATLELQLEEELRNALLANQGLQVFYQPIVDLSTGHVAKLEALVRWQHPQHGLLTPDRFIEIAETNGLIADLDNWVLRRACRDLGRLTGDGLENLMIAVNCSVLNLTREDLIDDIETALKQTTVPPRRLELEVTENALMGNISNTIGLLKQIRCLGVSLSIDDFGTGYSSLAYLKRLPLDTVKIDRSFIMDIPGSTQDMEIVQAIIVMAHTLHLKVVTEGVETIQQKEFLKKFGCDYIQGYLISRPQPLDQLLPLVRKLNQRKAISAPVTATIIQEPDREHWSHRPVR